MGSRIGLRYRHQSAAEGRPHALGILLEGIASVLTDGGRGRVCQRHARGEGGGRASLCSMEQAYRSQRPPLATIAPGERVRDPVLNTFSC